MGIYPDKMELETSNDTRVTINTYVPEYQRDLWKQHAELLDMNLSEFVRAMVQAGRRDFDIGTKNNENILKVNFDDKTPGVSGVKIQLLNFFQNDECLGWDKLVQKLTVDLEDELELALTQLQEENLIRYNGRLGGYTLLRD